MTDDYEKLRAQYYAMRKTQHDKDHARILAQRDRLAELLREIDMGLALIGGFPCTSQKIKAALAELDKEKQQ